MSKYVEYEFVFYPPRRKVKPFSIKVVGNENEIEEYLTELARAVNTSPGRARMDVFKQDTSYRSIL